MRGVLNMPLRKTARALARLHGHDGAIIITKSSDGVYHVGLAGLTDREVQDACCVGIHCNLLDMEARLAPEEDEGDAS